LLKAFNEKADSQKAKGSHSIWLAFASKFRTPINHALDQSASHRRRLSIAQFAGIQGVAPTLGVELIPIGVRDAGEIERAVTTFARSPNGGLIVTGSAPAAIHRDLIVTLAARHKLPAVYYGRFFGTAGGLISYGPDLVDQHRRAAGYVDRILKGEKPGDLPVQAHGLSRARHHSVRRGPNFHADNGRAGRGGHQARAGAIRRPRPRLRRQVARHHASKFQERFAGAVGDDFTRSLRATDGNAPLVP
jgi:ABC transporter substrate binding protein